jgi:hypothetical protein
VFCLPSKGFSAMIGEVGRMKVNQLFYFSVFNARTARFKILPAFHERFYRPINDVFRGHCGGLVEKCRLKPG